MPWKRACVEVTALAFLLAACASPPVPVDAEAGGSPDGVDYTMAIQCAGLGNAIRTFTPSQRAFGEGYRLGARYAVWAQQVSGASWAEVQTDIEISRKDFVREAGEGANRERVRRLETVYAGALGVCRTLADLPEQIFVGG